MEKGKVKVDAEAKTVSFGHETKTLDGKVVLTTTFDFSKVKFEDLLRYAGMNRLIGWRASTGIKGLVSVEAMKLNNQVVDCSATVTREKHVKTPEEIALEAMMKEALAKGGNMKDIMARVRAALAEKEDAELSEGETTE